MSTLSTQSNFADPNAAYRRIVEAHRGLSDLQSAALDTSLVLILANHIGDADVLDAAIALARRRMPDPNCHSGARERNASEPQPIQLDRRGIPECSSSHVEIPGSRPADAVRAPE